MMSTTRLFQTIALCVLVTTSASAQAPIDGKITGDAFRTHATRSYQQHARDNAQILYYSARCEQPLPPAVAKQQVETVRKNIESANKTLDALKEAHAAKPAVVKAIDKIKEQHKKVIAKCEELDAHLAKADKDTTVLCDCCVDVTDELDAAIKETGALAKELKVKELPKPAKEKAAKK